MTMRHTPEGRKSLEHAIRTTRLRWFTGRFITARDLTEEQEHALDRHYLHNRLLHGWGTVCGLSVHPHERQDCSREWVWVDAGIAIDCCGREILVPQGEAVRWTIDPSRTTSEDGLAILCLRYHECLADPLPAIVGDCAHGTVTEPGRVVEGWQFEVHPVTDDPNDPWAALLSQGADYSKPERSDDDAESEGTEHCADPAPCQDGCLSPACDLGDCIPLALLSRLKDEPIRIDVDQHGVRRNVRRVLTPPTASLTHVVETSWEHGSDIDIDTLTQEGGELRVRFDRDLQAEQNMRTGVNQFTFLVEIEDSTGNRERLDFDPKLPPRVENGSEAIFTLNPNVLYRQRRGGGPSRLVGDTVFVTLYGDLIHDCNGLPVDADFFGSFPTGDGIKGGVLRSWFFVSDGKETGT
jgi:hypothetical protein